MSYPLIWSSMETKKCLRKEKFNVSSEFVIEMTHMGYEISGPFHKEIHHPLTKTFCKQQCDWLINRVRKIHHPLTHSAPYRACWISTPFGGAEFITLQSLLKMLVETKNSPLSTVWKGDEANSAGCRGWWIPFWNGPKVGITRKFKLALFKLRGNSCIL